MLGPLQDNGGPTFTQALLSGSTAIDGGQSGGSNTDQRGFIRRVDFPMSDHGRRWRQTSARLKCEHCRRHQRPQCLLRAYPLTQGFDDIDVARSWLSADQQRSARSRVPRFQGSAAAFPSQSGAQTPTYRQYQNVPGCDSQQLVSLTPSSPYAERIHGDLRSDRGCHRHCQTGSGSYQAPTGRNHNVGTATTQRPGGFPGALLLDINPTRHTADWLPECLDTIHVDR